MAVRQPDHLKEVQDLFEKIERESISAYDITNTDSQDQEKFIPSGKIEAYFRENQYEQTRRLLRAVFGANPPVSARDVAEKCCRVCCILAALSRIRFIEPFFRHPNLRDDRLPFDQDSPPAHFPKDTGMKNFYTRFVEEQWKFCAPELCDTTSGVQFEEQSILPIIGLKYAGGGSSSIVYQATVHAQHDKLRSSRSSPNPDHCFAVKSYRRRNAQRNYEKEAEAFRRITEAGAKSARGIIDFYGSFEYRGSFNIILEYAAGGTLEKFWNEQERPANGDDFISFWESLFEVVNGVWWFHDHRLPVDSSDNTISEQGWHQDLKPENILVVVGGQGRGPNYKGLTFKIADFELSHFKTIMEGDDEPTTLGRWGTRTYGAPECHALSSITESRHNYVKRCIDVWSLGCIFSEAAVWAVKGSRGLQKYREDRCEAIRQIPGHRVDDCFHDKEKLLPVVEEQHSSLRSEYDRTDFITGVVVYGMIGRMLKHKPAFRPSAEELVDEGERAIKDARKNLAKAPEPTPLRNGGASMSKLPFRIPRHSNDTDDPFSGPPFSSRGILNEEQRFVSSPHATMHQDDAVVADNGLAFATFGDQGLPVSKGKARATGNLRVNSQAAPPDGHSRSESLQLSDMPERVSSPTSPPSTSEGGMTSEPAYSPLPNRKKPMPYCSREQARSWYGQRKNGNIAVQLADASLMNDLKDRDHVFFIDDSQTMEQHWREVQYLSHLLMYIVKEMDPDGVELYFLSSKEKLRPKTSTKMEKFISSRNPSGMTSLNRLNDDLVPYGKKLDQYVRSIGIDPPRPRSLYDFTDGVLDYGDDTQGQGVIKMIVDDIQRAKLLRGQVGIQFISFGNDAEGIARLQRLDRLNQDQRLGLDLVDTEPSNGNILKMLLGAINDRFDDDVISPVSSRASGVISPH